MVKFFSKYAIWMLVGCLGAVAITAALAASPKSEPPTINPFGRVARHQREGRRRSRIRFALGRLGSLRPSVFDPRQAAENL